MSCPQKSQLGDAAVGSTIADQCCRRRPRGRTKGCCSPPADRRPQCLPFASPVATVGDEGEGDMDRRRLTMDRRRLAMDCRPPPWITANDPCCCFIVDLVGIHLLLAFRRAGSSIEASACDGLS
ncbi:hypothetical protein ACLOJK_022438 [Asimina triloba]